MERDIQGLELQLGEEAPYFSLQGTDSKIYNISDFADNKALVVIFTCNHCPYAQAYEQRLIQLANTYQAKGVQFIAICANDADGFPEDDFEHMVEKAEKLELPYPYLHDETQGVAKAYDAACTPEVYLFDSERTLKYQGRIDDNHVDPGSVKHHYLRDALDAVLAGEEVPNGIVPAIGCSIKWK